MGDMADWTTENGELEELEDPQPPRKVKRKMGEQAEIDERRDETKEHDMTALNALEGRARAVVLHEPQTELSTQALKSSTTYDVSTLITVGRALARSGYFKDAQEEAQAVAKVLAGAELGIAPVAAMTGIWLVQGRITIGANILAALIEKSEKYNFEIISLTDEECVLQFYKLGKKNGQSQYTIADAKRAGNHKPNSGWLKNPRNMLFARAISNGSKWYCPDITVFPVYTPGEIEEGLELPEASKGGIRLADPEEIERLNNVKAENPFDDVVEGTIASSEDVPNI